MPLTFDLEMLTTRELILGVISLAPEGKQYFTEDALEERFVKVTKDYPFLRDIFHPTYDGSPMHSNAFHNTLAFSCMGTNILAEDGDFFIHMTSYGREYVWQELTTTYSPEIFEHLGPLAKKIWKD